MSDEGGDFVHNTCAAGAIELGAAQGTNIGQIVGGTVIVGGAIAAGAGAGIAINESITISQSVEKKKAKVEEIVRELEKTLQANDKLIVRWSTNTLKQLTPVPGTTDGLSFEIFSAAHLLFYLSKDHLLITTLNTINQSNILTALNDHGLHVSVRPIPPTAQSLFLWCETYDLAETARTEYSVFLQNILIRIY